LYIPKESSLKIVDVFHVLISKNWSLLLRQFIVYI